MSNLNDFIYQVQQEINNDLRSIENDSERILRLECDIDDAKQRIYDNRILLSKLKNILEEEK